MQEHTIRVVETFAKGLRPQTNLGRRQNYLTQCKYMKPRSWGLRDTRDVTDPFAASVFGTWPFPQLVRGKGTTLLLSATTVQVVTEASPNWTAAAALTTYDLADPTSVKAITGSAVWHMADFFNVWVLFNGTTTVIKTAEHTMFGETEKVYVQDDVAIQSGCEHRGRLITGGFDPSNLFGDDWFALWETWLYNRDYRIDIDLDNIQDNFVAWSSIAGGDMLYLLQPASAIAGPLAEAGYDDSNSFYMDLLKRNDMGFMPMPWQGSVLNVRPMGKGVIVYGDDGVAVMPMIDDPAVSFGMELLGKVGLASRGAVGGDEKRQVFIDPEGDLFSIDSQFSLTRLGYKEYLADLVGQDIIISMNNQTGEIYISGEDSSNNQMTFILTESGLGQGYQQITGCFFAEGDLLGVFDEPTDDTVALIVSDLIDFGYRDQKTITTFELGARIGADVILSVAVDYRYTTSAAWVRSTFKTVNPEGFARIQVTALEFRLVIKSTVDTAFELDEATIHWQPGGRRTVRGTNVDQANR